MEFQEIIEKYEKRIEDLKKELDSYKIWVEELQNEIEEYRSLN